MSNRSNIESMNAELAGVQCQIDQLSSVMQRRGASGVSRTDFDALVETVEALVSTVETMAGMIEGISETVGKIEGDIPENLGDRLEAVEAELETEGFENAEA